MSNQEIIQNVANVAQIGGFILAILTTEFSKKALEKIGKWKIPILFLIIGIAGTVAKAALKDDNSFKDVPTSESVIGRHFSNQQVTLDGRLFSHCDFDHVTFIYEAKRPFSIIDCKIEYSIFTSTKPEIVNYMHALELLGIMKERQ